MTYAEVLEDLTPRQTRAAIKALGPRGDWDHVQANVSKVDGCATVSAFRGRSGVRVFLGPRCGKKASTTFRAT